MGPATAKKVQEGRKTVATHYRAFIKKVKLKFNARDLIFPKELIHAQCQANDQLLDNIIFGEVPSVEVELESCQAIEIKLKSDLEATRVSSINFGELLYTLYLEAVMIDLDSPLAILYTSLHIDEFGSSQGIVSEIALELGVQVPRTLHVPYDQTSRYLEGLAIQVAKEEPERIILANPKQASQEQGIPVEITHERAEAAEVKQDEVNPVNQEKIEPKSFI